MKVTEFKKEFDEKVSALDRFNELEDADLIITKSSGKSLVLFMKDQEVLDYIKVEK